MCAQHLDSILGLEIKTSRIPGVGLGLFTTAPIDENTWIEDYKGVELTHDEATAESDINKYLLCDPDASFCIDAEDTTACAVRYINDVVGTHKKTNCTLVYVDDKYGVITTKKVRTGEELYASYGRAYWYGKL